MSLDLLSGAILAYCETLSNQTPSGLFAFAGFAGEDERQAKLVQAKLAKSGLT